jgi:hypothetical protein
VKTERTILSNKQEITIRYDGKGKCLLIDTGISGDRNVFKGGADKTVKYKNLIIEIQPIRNRNEKCYQK